MLGCPGSVTNIHWALTSGQEHHIFKEVKCYDTLDSGEPAEQERYNEEVATNHECCHAAKVYGDMVHNWFDSAGELFGQPEHEPNLNELLKIPAVSPPGQGTGLQDAVEVVSRYQHLIYAKLMRAVRGRLEEKQEMDDEFC